MGQDQAATRYAVIRSGSRDEDLEAVIRAMPEGAEVVAAFDPNKAGDTYTSRTLAAAECLQRAFRDERPAKGDWNDLLQQCRFSDPTVQASRSKYHRQ